MRRYVKSIHIVFRFCLFVLGPTLLSADCNASSVQMLPPPPKDDLIGQYFAHLDKHLIIVAETAKSPDEDGTHPVHYEYAQRDADAMCVAFKRFGYDVVPLLGPDASKKRLIKEIDAVRDSAKYNTLLVVYFTGHGAVGVVRNNPAHFLSMFDTAAGEDSTDGYTASDLLSRISLGSKGKALFPGLAALIVDACYSSLGSRGMDDDTPFVYLASSLETQPSGPILSRGTEYRSLNDQSAYTYFLTLPFLKPASYLRKYGPQGQITADALKIFIKKQLTDAYPSKVPVRMAPKIWGSDQHLMLAYVPSSFQPEFEDSDWYWGVDIQVLNTESRVVSKAVLDDGTGRTWNLMPNETLRVSNGDQTASASLWLHDSWASKMSVKFLDERNRCAMPQQSNSAATIGDSSDGLIDGCLGTPSLGEILDAVSGNSGLTVTPIDMKNCGITANGGEIPPCSIAVAYQPPEFKGVTIIVHGIFDKPQDSGRRK